MEKTKKKKSYLKVIVLGAISIASYIAVFTNQEKITELTTEGGWLAALPILAAFYFSFVHGAFASDLLGVLGIEAAKKKK